ncbi:hypothetical protein B0H11DRAFT_1939632 [Mycena galericulata]|nr:hypothetical protein B0H11DRAFT_1939632 [Mycena galericulata]
MPPLRFGTENLHRNNIAWLKDEVGRRNPRIREKMKYRVDSVESCQDIIGHSKIANQGDSDQSNQRRMNIRGSSKQKKKKRKGTDMERRNAVVGHLYPNKYLRGRRQSLPAAVGPLQRIPFDLGSTKVQPVREERLNGDYLEHNARQTVIIKLVLALQHSCAVSRESEMEGMRSTELLHNNRSAVKLGYSVNMIPKWKSS